MGRVGATITKAGRPRDPRLDVAMVQATLELLEERGYNDLSLAAIADRAGTTTAALYRRWGSKAELVMDAVFRTEGDDVVAETGDVAADLATMIRWSVEKICRPAALAAVAGMLGESRRERSAPSAAAAMASRRVAERIERAQAAGQIRSDADPMLVASMTAGPVMYAAFTDQAERIDEAWIERLVALVLDGVRPPGPGGSHPTDTGRFEPSKGANR